MHSRETCEWKSDEKDFCKKTDKKRETARVRTQGPLKTAKVGTSVPRKETAWERTRGL